VTELKIGDNPLRADGVRVLAEGCKTSTSLKTLDFSNRYGNEEFKMGPEGAKHIANLLTVNASVTSVDLSNGYHLCGLNIIGEGTYNADGINAIADAIAVTPSLTKISLAKNNLGSEGAKALAPAIRDSPSLTYLCLENNSLTEEAKDAIRSANDKRRTPVNIDF